ncbi:hypothetical protein [Metabacillus arenae]|uniref:Uncharacterized protein n=1 Tax=Metabacillus arenae TaxID=2771434 RepID=A0A926NIZ6_9BACI|nr:hypothetical protein [Metabacillus arenae]MBD1382584.1 hypothetical protein [Metabacillus arenae]
MLKYKVITACSIFSCMFGAAWMTNEITKRTYIDPVGANDYLIQNTAEQNSTINVLFEEEKTMEKFKPREYVRVIAR